MATYKKASQAHTLLSPLASSGIGPGHRARASFIEWLARVGLPDLPLGQI